MKISLSRSSDALEPVLLLFLLLLTAMKMAQAYDPREENVYLANFDAMEAASYSAANDPQFAEEVAVCQPRILQQQQNGGGNFPYVIVEGNHPDGDMVTKTSEEVQAVCSPYTNCIIGPDVQVIMTANLQVASLTIRGSMIWRDNHLQEHSSAVLCAGYVVVESGGTLDMKMVHKHAWIYLQDNGAKHDALGARALGGTGVDSKVIMEGRPLVRTWTLLDKPFYEGETVMQLLHDPFKMGWNVGDRIAVAPTDAASKGTGQTFTIVRMETNLLILDHPSTQPIHKADFARTTGAGGGAALLSAEVLNLSRTIVVTGDDLTNIPCDRNLSEDEEAKGCVCTNDRSTCTMGLHTMQALSGTMQIQHSRIEKCGQRGLLGRYCLHFHRLHDCPDCLFKGNAIEHSHQRGIVVHDTHRSEVSENVLWDVRGAGIYVEDGNELFNLIKYNVVICPYPLLDKTFRGCTVPGTPNRQSDSDLNQSGIYLTSPSNDLIGNRAANSKNGMFFEPRNAGGSRTREDGARLCAEHGAIGRWQGNTFHGHGRFGTYVLHYFPEINARSIETNGYATTDGDCAGFLGASGLSSGIPSAIVDHVDYDNIYVGQYDAGDVQYQRHYSVSSNNLIYWKETKNFADGCSAHFSGSHYGDGSLLLPDQATVILEDTTLENVKLVANHHCQVGVTGFLCQPQYILHNTNWISNEKEWVSFQDSGTNFGGIFSLSPDADYDDENGVLPPGYVSLVSKEYVYLLKSPNGMCVSSVDLGLGERYSDGILCKEPLRALKIYSRGLSTSSSPPALFVRVWYENPIGVDAHDTTREWGAQTVPFHQIGDGNTNKQGFSLPVLLSTADVSYQLSLEGDGSSHIPHDWVVEFSDPIMGNRWAPEFMNLELRGRPCWPNGRVSSQHDRRFLYSGHTFLEDERVWGEHGACVVTASAPPDMLPVSCPNSSSSLQQQISHSTECPELCDSSCDPVNSFCDCRTATCACKPGFTGQLCSIDLCAGVRCDSEHGTCSATYLGPSFLPPTGQHSCICDKGWTGSICSVQDTKPEAYASSSKLPAANAIDRDLETRWESFHTDSEWLVIDLREVKQLSTLQIQWEYAFGKAYDIDLSINGVNWQTTFTEDDGDGGLDIIQLNGASARFVKINGKKRGTKWGYSVKTVELAGPEGVFVPRCDCPYLGECEKSGSCGPDGSCLTAPLPDFTECNSVPFVGMCWAGVCRPPQVIQQLIDSGQFSQPSQQQPGPHTNSIQGDSGAVLAHIAVTAAGLLFVTSTLLS